MLKTKIKHKNNSVPLKLVHFLPETTLADHNGVELYMNTGICRRTAQLCRSIGFNHEGVLRTCREWKRGPPSAPVSGKNRRQRNDYNILVGL